MQFRPLSLAIAAIFSMPAVAAEPAATILGEIVVTAPQMQEPLTVSIDPKAPYQPVPANDGAALLKNIPGFNVIRKGGTDGDPTLRGLAGSRLNILVDGSEILGGCPNRMDPPTAYIFPETFDSVTVLKGPQTVAYGNGNLAGVVKFDRDQTLAHGAKGFASATAGAWGRTDALIGVKSGGERILLDGSFSKARAGDYKDGAGRSVHSEYERQSLNAKLGFNASETSRLTFDLINSSAQAAYADRSMDGSQFDRDTYSMKLEKKNLSSLVGKVEALVYYNHVDHVMDNYTLRTPSYSMTTMMYTANAMDVDRKTKGARLSTDLNLGDTDLLKLGADWQTNAHSGRMGMGMGMTAGAAGAAATANYLSKPKLMDVETDITGIYSELRHELGDMARVIGGLRFDSWHADRYNNAVNPIVLMRTADEDLQSMFVRYERDLSQSPATFFVGLGHAERPMDYWEMKTYNGLSTSALVPQLKPEASTQLDTGINWKGKDFTAGISVFYAKLSDYLLTYSRNVIGQCDSDIALSNGAYNCAFNVDATRYGGEADLAWRFLPAFTLRGALAYVHADNDTMNVPLAQTPPLEGRVGLDYTTGAWTVGGLVRLVASQDRVHVGYGNIVGQDIGTTPGFATLAINAAYKPSKKWMVSAGIDNLLDKAYSEHLSRGDTVDSGLPTGSRVFEPGRFIWAKLNLNFE